MGVSGVRSQSTTGRGRLCAACSCLSLVLGVLLLALGFWSTYMHVRFTPVYSDITCTLRDPKLAPDAVSRLSLGSLDLVQETVCYNPNPYSVKIMSTKPSGVFIGDDRDRVATITQIPATTLEAGDTSTVKANLGIKISGDLVAGAMGVRLEGLDLMLPIFFENNLEVDVHAEFLFGGFRAKQSFSKDCGVNVRVRLTQVTMGPMTCADDWDHLVLEEPGDEAAFSKPIVASPERMGEDDQIEEAERAKNIALGTSMGVGYGLGLCLLLGGAAGVVRWRRAQKQDGDAEASIARAPADMSGLGFEGAEGRAQNAAPEAAPKVAPPASGQRQASVPEEAV